MRQSTRCIELSQGELRTLIPCVESTSAEVDGIGTIGNRRANRVERASGREEFRDYVCCEHPGNLAGDRGGDQVGEF